jgi:hypothetical protein
MISRVETEQDVSNIRHFTNFFGCPVFRNGPSFRSGCIVVVRRSLPHGRLCFRQCRIAASDECRKMRAYLFRAGPERAGKIRGGAAQAPAWSCAGTFRRGRATGFSGVA